jgi:hypothetical protein
MGVKGERLEELEARGADEVQGACEVSGSHAAGSRLPFAVVECMKQGSFGNFCSGHMLKSQVIVVFVSVADGVVSLLPPG